MNCSNAYVPWLVMLAARERNELETTFEALAAVTVL